MVFCQKLADLVLHLWYGGSGPYKPPLQPEICFVWERTLPVSPLRRVIREIWLAMPVGLSVKILRQDPDSPYPMDFILDMFHELSKHPNNLKLSSYSGKTPVEVKATCKTFFEDAAPEEKQ